MNMDVKSLEECNKLFDQTKGYNYPIIYENCSHPLWKKTNLWIPLRQKLNESKEKFNQIIQKLQEKHSAQPRKSVQLLIDFYTIKNRIIEESLTESNKIEQENKALNGGKLPEGSKIFKDEL